MIINRGFIPKKETSKRLPPGQYETKNFPVLSLGPTPVVALDKWELDILGLADNDTWDWEEFSKLPMVQMTSDIHCVTKWSKFDTKWSGVSFDHIIDTVHVKPDAKYIVAYSYDGYTTNLPIEDVKGNQAMVATSYDGNTITAEHGGPARLLVPHLYFWKSAKWLRAIEFTSDDRPGFWEVRGYNNYGDPWKEERYSDD